MAIRMIAAVAGIGEPVHRSVSLHFVGRITLFVVILAVFILDRRRITRAIGECKSDAEDPRGDHDSHDQSSHGSCSLNARKESGTSFEEVIPLWRLACDYLISVRAAQTR